MFGFSVQTTVSADRLVISSPFSLGLLVALCVFILWPLLIFVNTKPFPVLKVMVFSILFLLVFGLFPSQANLTLDRPSNTLTLRRYFFFHWITEILPLSSLDNASVRTGSGTSKIQLQLVGGGTRTLSELNQMRGKDQAVYEINQFIGNGK